MSLSHPAPSNPAVSVSTIPSVLAAGDRCPVCDQPVPDERLDEIRARIDAQRSAQTAEVTSRLRIEFTREKADAIETARREAAQNAQEAQVALQAKIAEAEAKAKSIQETSDARLAKGLLEQREVLERAQTAAVNAEKSAAFEKERKLSDKIEELQRALANKTAEELGEGAEIDLFEVLRSAFEDDKFERVNKGQPGADIIHVVMHNGKECGRIIYDSKNHNAWRNDFVTKLAADQMAARADHAILATRKFPSGTRHLHVQDGVILASPSRVVAVVEIIRQHVVHTHTLRLSGEARSQKTAQLYKFMTSQRCRDLFKRIDTHTDDLLDLQIKEKKAHEANWKKQGELLRSVQKIRAEICNELDLIVGGANDSEQAGHE